MDKIYILVKVTYDYYRFQENIDADTNKEKLLKRTEKLEYGLFYYDKDSELQYVYDERESAHYWVQEITIKTEKND